MRLAARGVHVGCGLGAGLVREGGGLGAGGGDQPVGLRAGLLQQALGLLLGADPGLLGPGDVLVDVPFGAAAQLGQLVVELAAAVGELGLQARGALGGLGHQTLGGRLRLAQLAFGVRAQLLGLHLGVAEQLLGLAGDGVEGARLGELPTGLVQLGPEHLDLVGEVLGMLDGLVPLLASPIHLGLELGEVVFTLVAVVAPHSAVPSISWSRPRPGRPGTPYSSGPDRLVLASAAGATVGAWGGGARCCRAPPSGWTPGRTLASWRMVTDPNCGCSAVPAQWTPLGAVHGGAVAHLGIVVCGAPGGTGEWGFSEVTGECVRLAGTRSTRERGAGDCALRKGAAPSLPVSRSSSRPFQWLLSCLSARSLRR